MATPPYTTTVARMADGVSFDDVRAELGAALPGYSVRVGPAENVAAFDALRRSAGIQRATWWVVAATLALIAAVFVDANGQSAAAPRDDRP